MFGLWLTMKYKSSIAMIVRCIDWQHFGPVAGRQRADAPRRPLVKPRFGQFGSGVTKRPLAAK